MNGAIRGDRGFTLAELLICSMLLILVIGGVGGIFLSAITADAAVRNSTSAARSGQLATASLTKGVRQAHALDVSAPFAGALLVRAMIVDDPSEGSAQAHCEAWVITGGEIRTKRSATAIGVPANADAVSEWTLLATGVSPVDGRPMAAAVGAGVELVFQVAPGDGARTLIETQAVTRQVDPVSGQPAPLPAPLQENQCF